MTTFGYTQEQWNAIITLALVAIFLIGSAVGLIIWYVDTTSIHHAEQCLVGCLSQAHALEVLR